MAGRDVLTDEQWARIALLLPPEKGPMGRPQKLHRRIVDGIVHRYRAGLAWRDLPERYGPWQTVWTRHHKWSVDGRWDAVLAALLADADAAGVLDWKISADSTVVRAHQPATTTFRDEAGLSSYTGAHPPVLTGG